MSYKITLPEEYFFCIVGLLKSVWTNQLRRISMAQSNNIIDTMLKALQVKSTILSEYVIMIGLCFG